MEGAISYSITFDPLTKTEPNHDYVRFLKVFGIHRLIFVLLFFVRSNIPRGCCQCCTNVPIAFYRKPTTRSGKRRSWCCRDHSLCFVCLPPSASYTHRIGERANITIFCKWALPGAAHAIRSLVRVLKPLFVGCRLEIDRMSATKTASASEKIATRAVGMDRSRIGRE